MTYSDSPIVSTSLQWFCRRFTLLLFNPIAEWQKASVENVSEGALFKGYTARISALSPLLMLPFVFLPDFYMGRMIGIMSCIFIFGLNLALIHLYAVVFESLAAGLGGDCSKIASHKLAAYSVTPWLFLLGLFPLLRELSLIGLLWTFILFVLGSKYLVNIDSKKRWKFILLSAFLCLVILFLSNLFFAGVLGIIVGPQAPR